MQLKVKTSLVAGLMSLASFCGALAVHAGELLIHPSLGIGEEYTDNVFQARENRRTDYVTRILPGIALKYNAPLWDWDIAYNYDYRYYAHNSRNDDDTHNLAGKGFIRIIDDFLLLDVSDTYRRVSLDVTRDRTEESLFLNQSDSNTVNASPYFVFRPGWQTTVKTGYRYTNVWYREPTAVDKREHGGFLDATFEYSPKFTLSAGYAYTRQNSVNAHEKHAPYVGARYEYADKSFSFAEGGYTWFDFKNGFSSKNAYWSAGLTHTFTICSVYAKTSVQYPEDPLTGVTKETNYTVGLDKSLERGTVGLSIYYSDYDEESVNGVHTTGTLTDITRKYGATVTAKYDLTHDLTGSLYFSAEKYDHEDIDTYTRRIYVSPGLTYAFPRGLTVALNYSFIDYYSPGIFADNYRVNRVVFEVRKSF